MEHQSILLKEAVEGLQINPSGIYIDGTLGRGGHSAYLLAQIPQGFLYCFDQDETAIAESLPRLSQIGSNFAIVHRNFVSIKEELANRNITGVDGMMFDLGVSSPQFDDGERGFSYHQDAMLDMRMDRRQSLSAHTIVNTWTYEELVRIFYLYGEESFAKSIARRIEAVRKDHMIDTTGQLVDVIKEGIPKKFHAGKHPARKVFQALRIAVNDELGVLERMLEECLDLLNEGGRMSVITFHSLEDRIVKEAFLKRSTPPKLPKHVPVTKDQLETDYLVITKKPLVPSEEEIAQNPRARSAKLRIIERKRNIRRM